MSIEAIRFIESSRRFKVLIVVLSLFYLNVQSVFAFENSINHTETINFDWRFHHGDIENALSLSFDDSKWENINVPHDWSIKNIGATNSPFVKNSPDEYDTGYTKGGIGWYRKKIVVPENLNEKVAILEFGGIYMNSEVYVNGNIVGGQHYGYTSFWIDISEHLNFGDENIIAIKVNNNHLNSRWYSGSGIYRPVSLSFKARVHIERWGTSISTPKITKKKANIKVSTVIVNQLKLVNVTKHTDMFLFSQILNNEDEVVSELKSKIILNQLKTLENIELIVNNPKLWSPKSPQLYTLKQTIIVNGRGVDVSESIFGIRKLKFDSKNGFLINEHPMLLQGLNIHHDNYLLGSAAHERAEVRKVEKILAAGYNAVRTAHNPPSTSFLNAADRLGLLVINEAFDTWNNAKSDHVNDYSSKFKQDWQTDLTNFIKRDRNHPSVIMWSLGNEIPEQNDKQGADTAAMLKDFVLSLDDTRQVTIGANTSGVKSDPYLQNFNVVGYNYQEMNYVKDHNRFPERLMYGSETYSNRAFEYWQYVEKYPYIFGDFVWTGWDYIGEASIGWTGYAPQWKSLAPYPWTLAYCGEIDALGFKRPASYYRDVLWKTGKNRISAFVKSPELSLQPEQNPSWYLYWVNPDLHPSWTWPEAKGETLEVVVYSIFEEVELFLNGKSLRKKSSSKESEFKAKYLVPYEEGELKVVGYSNSKPMDEWILNTAGKPAQIRLTKEREAILSDGMDIIYITAELFDKSGQRVYHWNDDLVINFNVSGPGELLALGNANPRSIESFEGSKRTTFRGRVVAVIQSRSNQSGDIQIKATAKGLKSAIISVIAK